MSTDDAKLAEQRAQGKRLRLAREHAGLKTGTDGADYVKRQLDVSKPTYLQHENGTRGFKARAHDYARLFGVPAEWLLWDKNPPAWLGREPARRAPPGFVPIIGYVGADPEGRVLMAHGQDPQDYAPAPPGADPDAVAVEVRGHSMRGFVDDGGLIYFEQQHTTIPSDMLGQVVVMELESGEVLVKRLLRGSKKGRFDLESLAGPMRSDERVKWAAHITAIIPPHQARRIIKREAA